MRSLVLVVLALLSIPWGDGKPLTVGGDVILAVQGIAITDLDGYQQIQARLSPAPARRYGHDQGLSRGTTAGVARETRVMSAP
jgi:hypothetical protein